MTKQIRDQLDQMINAGTLAAGTFLPSERELANSLKVARNVVRGAYEQLMSIGKVQSEGRRGRSIRSAGKKRTSTSKTKSSAKARKK
ncbi:MAG TPA: GntR family transcriptional regulator [Pyrinomonadaceae bacterium]|nr:GntR family transcriptional regulator [Pyrinomonadaceae bacterium]